jgi:VWFA-related protein
VPEKFLPQRPSEKERMAMMASKKALKNFAEKSGGTFIEASGGEALRKAFQEIVAELGSQYTITYLPDNKTKDGKWREIEVRVAKSNLNIRTRKGYNAPKVKVKK